MFALQRSKRVRSCDHNCVFFVIYIRIAARELQNADHCLESKRKDEIRLAPAVWQKPTVKVKRKRNRNFKNILAVGSFLICFIPKLCSVFGVSCIKTSNDRGFILGQHICLHVHELDIQLFDNVLEKSLGAERS